MTLDLCHAIDNIRRAGGITQAPPCHRVGFGHTVDDDRFFLDVLSQRCEAVEAKVFVHQLVVDLICDNVHILEMYLQKLPELARAIAEPLSKVDKIVLVGGDKGTGATKITSQVADILAQMPDVVESLTGVDLKKYFQEKFKIEEKTEDEE